MLSVLFGDGPLLRTNCVCQPAHRIFDGIPFNNLFKCVNVFWLRCIGFLFEFQLVPCVEASCVNFHSSSTCKPGGGPGALHSFSLFRCLDVENECRRVSCKRCGGFSVIGHPTATNNVYWMLPKTRLLNESKVNTRQRSPTLNLSNSCFALNQVIPNNVVLLAFVGRYLLDYL